MRRSPSDIGVLFDIDDTLVDFAGAARLALLDVAVRFRHHRSADDDRSIGEQLLRSWEAVSEREYGRFLVGELSFDQMLVSRMAAVVTELDPSGSLGLDPVELERLRGEAIFAHYRQYDDVPAALARLEAAGIAVGVVSNSDGDYQRRKMTAAGLDHLTPAAVFSGDLGVSKPDPVIFVAGAAALGLPPHRVVYVGDRWATDAVGALRAGLAAVWVNRRRAPRPQTADGELRALPGAAARLAELTRLESLDGDLAARLVGDRRVRQAARDAELVTAPLDA